ncbi:SDR family oxidoreductase [Rossellomorea aquimaris]|uniref:SDR family oxidoreductase n=1 Tax=Rossellomorea aquimaris TaxID=189382 RepID=A0A5D4UKP6_9BACI|nr:SDR family oxidoreductase [Rossellomorea aquimaris]TYS81553.1 SDR family oxidoreductase [Rossellomorea aquimaris]TYS88175.1 SDR family oxidoreductase [Rossellomorea aquimaris]
MNVAVVGANGQIGKQVIGLLKESSEHTPRAIVRKEEQARAFEQDGVQSSLVDLEGTVDEITHGLKGADAVVFTAGSGGKTGADKTLLIDLDGAVKTMEAAKQAGIDRFIMVSALQAHNRENWNESLKPYYVAKHFADRALEQSGLTYTIIRPGGLLNEAGKGKVTAGENLSRESIPREDVAGTVVASLDEERTFNKGFDLITGNDGIEVAVRNV